MRKPNESLKDFSVRSASEIGPEAPRRVSLRRTGDVEVLKPLARTETPPRSAPAAFGAFRPSGRQQPLWFRRFLAVGSGALVFMALVLVSAILVSITDPAAGPDVGANENSPAQLQELFAFDLSTPMTLLPIAGGDQIRTHTRRRPVRSSTRVTVRRPKPQLRPLPQPEEPTFVPTTLVIYAENGVINTRIEPWLQGADRKKPSYNN
jgi:hypothetical protein